MSGQLQGVREISGLFNIFFAFKGIPYAEPPVGDLRFKNPVPHKGWSGVRDASNHGDHCPNDGLSGIGAGGHENCLFLNVYTPNLTGNLSVMVCNQLIKNDCVLFKYLFVRQVWIHGGAFIIGDGNDLIYGADLLVRENVIVVTLNYRLSSLGFLSTGDKHAQGNYGLKDMVVALKWVKKNIAAFGGNGGRITIFGQSAGSVAIHLLLVAGKHKGLFHQAIMQSGTALAPFALRTNPLERAEALGHSLRLQFNSTETLIEQLRTVDFRQILNAERGLFSMDHPLGLRPFDFVPCVEPEGSLEEVLLSDEPINLMLNGTYRNVSIPLIIGTTSNEGLLMVRQTLLDRRVFDDYNRDDSSLVPLSFNLSNLSSNSTIIKEVADKFKSIYFNGQNLSSETIEGWAQYHTDAQFKFPADRTLKIIAETATKPIYYYNFSFEGALNFLKTLLFLRGYPGVCHADDIFYLFTTRLPIPVWPSDHALTIRRRYIRLFTNFVKYG